MRAVQPIGMLAPGATVAGAQAELDVIARRLAAQYPDLNGGRGVRVRLLRDALAGELRGPLAMLLASTLVLLFIASLNVANLQMARAAARTRELAIRAALGASRLRLVQQLLIDNLVAIGSRRDPGHRTRLAIDPCADVLLNPVDSELVRSTSLDWRVLLGTGGDCHVHRAGVRSAAGTHRLAGLAGRVAEGRIKSGGNAQPLEPGAGGGRGDFGDRPGGLRRTDGGEFSQVDGGEFRDRFAGARGHDVVDISAHALWRLGPAREHRDGNSAPAEGTGRDTGRRNDVQPADARSHLHGAVSCGRAGAAGVAQHGHPLVEPRGAECARRPSASRAGCSPS